MTRPLRALLAVFCLVAAPGCDSPDGAGAQTTISPEPIELAVRPEPALPPGAELPPSSPAPIDPWANANSGRLSVRGPDGDAALTVEKLSVRVTVVGRMARTEVTQVFRSHLPRQSEGTYRFTLPHGAALSRLAMDVEGKLMEGELVERQRARQIYEQIVRAARDPALVEWQGQNRFQTQIFPIPARGTKTVILAYEQLLPRRGQTIGYRYDLPALGGGGVANTTAERTEIDQFEFELRGSRVASATVRTGALDVQERGGQIIVSQRAEGFVPKGPLSVDLQANPGETAVFLGSKGADRYFLVDWIPAVGSAAPLEIDGIVFAVDSSAGIGDVELRRASKVIEGLLSSLPPDTEVAVVHGDVDVFTCGPAVAASDAKAVLDCLKKLRPGGATDLEKLMVAAGQTASKLKGTSAVVALTDGVASLGTLDADLLEARVLAARRDVPLHTVALGHAPAEDALASLSQRSGGHAIRFFPDQSVAGVVETLAHLVRQPLLTDVAVRAEKGDVAQLSPGSPLRLARGEPMAILGRTASDDVELVVSAKLGDRTYEQRIEVELGEAPPAELLPRFWARAAIDDMQKGHVDRKAVVDLSLSAGVMSRYTSFLVLENDEAYKRFNVDRRRQAERDGARSANASTRSLRKGKGDLAEVLDKQPPTDSAGGPEGPARRPAPEAKRNAHGLGDLVLDGLALQGAGSGGGGSGRGAEKAEADFDDESMAEGGEMEEAPAQDPAAAPPIGGLATGTRGGIGARRDRAAAEPPSTRSARPSKTVAKKRGARRAPGRAKPMKVPVEIGDGRGAPCWITVNTTPWTKVSLDGKPVGSSPVFRLEAKAGKHKLHFVNEQAGIDVVKTVSCRPGKELRRGWKLEGTRLVKDRAFESRRSRAPRSTLEAAVVIVGRGDLADLSADQRRLQHLAPQIGERCVTVGKRPMRIELHGRVKGSRWVLDEVRVDGRRESGAAKRCVQDGLDGMPSWAFDGTSFELDGLVVLDSSRSAAEMALKSSLQDQISGGAAPALVQRSLVAALLPGISKDAALLVFDQLFNATSGANERLALFDRPELAQARQGRFLDAASEAAALTTRQLEVVLELAADRPQAAELVVPRCQSRELDAGRCLAFARKHRAIPAVKPLFEKLAKEQIARVQDARRLDMGHLGQILEVVALLEELSRPDEAARVLSEIVEFAPHDYSARVQYGRELVRREQLTEGCGQLAAAVQLNPAQRDTFREMMGLARSKPEETKSVRECIVDGVSNLPVQRAMSLVLTWDDPTADIDLHIIEAGDDGEHVFFRNRESKTGGLLYYDITDGLGPEIYVLGTGEAGRYHLELVYYSGEAKDVRATLTVLKDAGSPQERRETRTVVLAKADSDKPYPAGVVELP